MKQAKTWKILNATIVMMSAAMDQMEEAIQSFSSNLRLRFVMNCCFSALLSSLE